MDIAQAGLGYSQISIDKPTLEDYFISIARKLRDEPMKFHRILAIVKTPLLINLPTRGPHYKRSLLAIS